MERLEGPPLASDVGPAGGERPVLDRLAAVEGQLEALTQAIERLQPGLSRTYWGTARTETIPAEELESRNQELASALAGLEKQIVRAGREQFKASTLAEAQRDQLAGVLEALQSVEAERQAEVEAIRARGEAELEAASQRLGQARQEARLGVIREVLPALDGLDEALRTGRRVLDRPAPPLARRGLFTRAPAPPADDTLRQDMDAWLVGLGFVRDRLLGLLAAEGVAPIAAAGQPFDPEWHVALEAATATPDAPPGAITAVLRQGYRVGDRVLRHAEVAVAREQEEGGEAG